MSQYVDVIRLFGILILLALLGYIGPEQVINTLLKTNPMYFSLSIFFGIVSTIFMLLRWDIILKSLGYRIPLKPLYKYTLLGLLANNIIPGRLGDIPVRAYFLKKEEGISYKDGLASSSTDRYIDIFSLFFIGFLCIYLYMGYVNIQSAFFQSVRHISLIVLILMMLFPLIMVKTYKKLFVFLKNKIKQEKIINIIEKAEDILPRIIENFKRILTIKNSVILAISTLTMWFMFSLAFYFLVLAFGETLPLPFLIACFFISYIFGLISMIPGGYGSSEVGLVVLASNYAFGAIDKAAITLASGVLKVVNLVVMLLLVILISSRSEIDKLRQINIEKEMKEE